ncbi:TIGR03557 family F420-dependent LLM class oxidoreductase [Streptomyces sp. LN500]|uniref:TIGR03557 family F420-dependent LLM class oxidoreductase n=1 Tax=Streptomyces sp. LN500 TaxID=3112978 RepID=UPI0037171C27
MGVRTWVSDWPVYRQLTGTDPLGRGRAAVTAHTQRLRPRTETAERVVPSICPYCAVGCGQQIYVKDDKVVQIEGDPASPISRGRLCPKGSATLQLTTGSARRHEVLYRRPYAADWEPLDLETAMDMVADRVVETRRRTWEWEQDGLRTARTLGIASLGGATLDNEENYLIKKLFTGLGVVQVENQARVCHSTTVAGLGTSFGRGGATTFMQDLQHADCIVIQGSNFAEAHPVGFQWVMEAKERGARIIHVDPRFMRTSALADLHVPIRAGSDIAFLGAVINHVLTEEKDFREYVLAYTNAASIISEDFQDTEDLDGVFSGLDPDKHHYDPRSWQYEGVEAQAPAGDVDEQYEQKTQGEAVEVIRSLLAGENVNHHGVHFDVENAKLWDLPDTPPPIGIAVSGDRSCELAGLLADLVIATEPEPALISAFDRHGGAGKPKIGQMPICYDTDRDAAIARAHDQARWFGGGWPVNSELPGPDGFAGATQFVRPEDVARTIPCGDDVDAVVEAVRPYVDAGFTEVALVQIGGDHQEPYLEWSQHKLLPALREL